MRWPWVSRARFDAAEAFNARLWREEHERAEAWLSQLNNLQTRYADLLDKYHALRMEGQAVPLPPAPVVESPLAQLGPLTRAALTEMANGQPAAVKRAMQSKAVALWLQAKDSEHRDDLVAKAVWQGEVVNPS